jgi:large subunit ribosomal protein L18
MAKDRISRIMRVTRHKRARGKIYGTADRPRLSLFRSLNHIYAQVIDDTQSSTLAFASSNESQFKEINDPQTKQEISSSVGSLIAERAKAQGVAKVVFDKGGYKYHGRVKALAEAAREAGLEF